MDKMKTQEAEKLRLQYRLAALTAVVGNPDYSHLDTQDCLDEVDRIVDQAMRHWHGEPGK